jgi:hypothetical protein
MKLIIQRPELKAEVLALIPPPDLTMATHALVDASRRLKDAYPFSQQSTFGTSTSFGFASSFSFGVSAAVPTPSMRPEYIQSRIQPAVNDFISTVHSYLPYFSFVNTSAGPTPSILDAFNFLAALTQHILLEQQPLAVAALSEGLRDRIVPEWKAWTEHLSVAVNSQGRMFPAGVVHEWSNKLDAFANQTHVALGQDMRTIRDAWVQQAGWLINRRAFVN